jgi:hypothetical protein
MTRIGLLAIALLCTFQPVRSLAQAPSRVFVAAQGSDGNPCSFVAPCRTFQHAHGVVAAGGEIDVLDPAGYGAVAITKAISIQGHGFSGISVGSGATAITVNVGATDVVNLSGLLIEGTGVGGTGVAFVAGKFLTIQDCLIRNLTSHGIAFTPAVSASRATLNVSNTIVANNGGHGILVLATGNGFVNAAFDRVQVIGNGIPASGNDGILIDSASLTSGNVRAVVTESVANRNNNVGFGVVGTLSAPAALSVFHSVSAFNNTALESDGNSALRVAQTTATGNTSGWLTQTAFGVMGQILSYGDNYVRGNDQDEGSQSSESTN